MFESRDTEKDHIKLDNMPGGAAAFELAVKCCYGIPIMITRTNVAALRCAAEYLEMTEDLEEGNLVSKTEDFLSSEILISWSDSITVLRTCETLSPWAEKLQIVKMCSESIAWKACTDPRGIRWSYSSAGSESPSLSPKGSAKSSTSSSKGAIPHDWWFADVAELNPRSFKVVMDAIKAKGMRHDMMGSAIFYYAHRWLPGLSSLDNPGSPVLRETSPKDKKKNKVSNYKRENGHGEGFMNEGDAASQALERVILEGIVEMLPPQKDSVSVSGLLRLLRVAIMLDVAPGCKNELEKRSGMQLDQAVLNDLLIPSCPFRSETLHDVGAIHRCLDHFLVQVSTALLVADRAISDRLGFGDQSIVFHL